MLFGSIIQISLMLLLLIIAKAYDTMLWNNTWSLLVLLISLVKEWIIVTNVRILR